MQMRLVDIVHILRGAVAGSAHITNHIPGLHDTPFLQIESVRKAFPQMGVIVIPLFVKAPDTDPPAAVLVPAKSFHNP